MSILEPRIFSGRIAYSWVSVYGVWIETWHLFTMRSEKCEISGNGISSTFDVIDVIGFMRANCQPEYVVFSTPGRKEKSRVTFIPASGRRDWLFVRSIIDSACTKKKEQLLQLLADRLQY
jgi:hypothetical protein